MKKIFNIIKYLNYNYIKGYEYEKHVLSHINNIYDIKEAYLWKYVPDNLLIESGIIIDNDLQNIKEIYNIKNKTKRNYNILFDTGIDIICKLKDNTIILIQSKAYSSIVSQKHLAGFFRTLLDSYLINQNKDNKIIGLICHTSSVSDLIKSSYCYKNNIISDLYIPFTLTKNIIINKYFLIYNKKNQCVLL
jgi:hypothetical protein